MGDAVFCTMTALEMHPFVQFRGGLGAVNISTGSGWDALVQ